MASFADFEFNLIGFAFALLSAISQTAFNVSSKACLAKANLSSVDGFFVCCCICTLAFQCSFNAIHAIDPASEHVFSPALAQFQSGDSWAALILFLVTFSYFVEYQLNFLYVSCVSSLTFTITDIVRRLITICANAVMFDKELTPLNLSGIGVSLSGALLYAVVVNKPAAKKKILECSHAKKTWKEQHASCKTRWIARKLA